jgi:hypothetical protein
MLTTSSRGTGTPPRRVAALIAAVGLTLAVALPAAGRPAGSALTAHRIISPQPTAKEFSQARFSKPLVINNRWTPLIPGTEFVLDGVVRRGRKVLKHRIVSLVTDLKKVVDGIPCVVVWERDFSLGRLQESELFFAAQDDNKNVWLFGEYPELWNNGRFKGAPDTWIAPTFGTQPGIFMYQSPRVGQIFSEGYAPHIKFYDRARVLRKGLKICTPARCYKDVMEIDEYAPYNPGDAHQRVLRAGIRDDPRQTGRGTQPGDRVAAQSSPPARRHPCGGARRCPENGGARLQDQRRLPPNASGGSALATSPGNSRC